LDFGLDDEVAVLRINVQPVIPFSIGPGWNLISRTILPILDFDDVPIPGTSEFGLGDTVQSLFFSPKAPTAGGWIWGAGVSATFIQPFLTYATPTQTTFALNTESTYDWETNKWSVPINLTAAQVMRFGNQLVQIGGGFRYWIATPDTGPEDWGLRLQFTLLFPK
jgi:hypothetical protein